MTCPKERLRRPILLILPLLLWHGCLPGSASALNLEEALANARKSLPAYHAVLRKVEASEALYTASFSPYLPSLDGSASESQHQSRTETYDVDNYKLALSQTMFDGGKRRANRRIAGANLATDREEIRKIEIDLVAGVATAFFSAIARRDIVAQRQLQLGYSEKDHEVAEGRNRLGAVTRSDVLQALVRMEQARYNVIESEGDYRKALADLNSLMGRPLQDRPLLDGTLDEAVSPPAKEALAAAARQRPEIVQAQRAIDLASHSRSLAESAFFPVVTLNAAHDKNDSELYRTSYPEENIIGVSANWNFFEWGKFYKVVAANREISAAEMKLEETKRKVLLELSKAEDDFLTSSDKLRVAGQQLVHADHNYQQALGEYKAGQGDILSLVQAESLLSDARGQEIAAKLAVILAKVQWEKVAGLPADTHP